MSIAGALILFVVFILIYIGIAEIFTVLFRLTGLTTEKARFQVISMLTNSGFTTSESELITKSKIRRKLARITMLFGYAFTVTIVSIIVNIFIALTQAEMKNIYEIILISIILFIILYIIRSFSGIKETFDRYIQKIGNKLMFGDSSNAINILDTYDNKVIAEIWVTNIPSELNKVPLIKSNLKTKYNSQVLLIKRDNELLTTIDGNTVIEEGDIVVVFGEYQLIRHLFENPDKA